MRCAAGELAVHGRVPDRGEVYQAHVEIKDPSGNWVVKRNPGTGQPVTNTMYPKDWDAVRIKAETNSAWADPNKITSKDKWFNTSTSGVEMQGYIDPNVTAFPKY